MKLRLLLFGLIMFIIPTQAQSLIGLTKDEVRNVIKKEHRDLLKDNSIVIQEYNYLKFVKRNGDATLIVYFSDDDICKTSKFVYDYAVLDEVVKNLNRQHEKVEDYIWRDRYIQVTLTKQEWYFTVRTTKI